MNKFNFISLLLLLTALLASCSSDKFKIDGNIDNLKAGVVRVIFMGDSGIVDEETIVDNKGHFTFKGSSSVPVIVSVIKQRGEALATLVAINGDHLKIKGDADKPADIKTSGNRLNKEWQLFRDEHAAFYADPNPSRLDAAIEKYVREHPADMLSTVLLMADYSDYSDYDKIEKMLKGIDAEARPESLTQTFKNDPNASKRNLLPRLMTLTLWKHGGNFDEIKLTGHTSFISFWASPQKDRMSLINKLKTLDAKIHIIDVLAESDTLRWHQTIAADPEGWRHYWAPGGPMEQGIQLLGFTSLPWFAVTDSTGLVTYSGPDINAALKTAQP